MSNDSKTNNTIENKMYEDTFTLKVFDLLF